jgi:hypothetical protein
MNSYSEGSADYEKAAGRELDADWLLITSIQNSFKREDNFYGYGYGKNSQVSGVSNNEVAILMRDFLGLTNIDQKYYTEEATKEAMNPIMILENLEWLKSQKYEIIMSINAQLIKGKNSNFDSNHSVTYIGDFKTLENGNISFKVQSWGKKMTVNTTLDDFKKFYNGSTWGK